MAVSDGAEVGARACPRCLRRGCCWQPARSRKARCSASAPAASCGSSRSIARPAITWGPRGRRASNTASRAPSRVSCRSGWSCSRCRMRRRCAQRSLPAARTWRRRRSAPMATGRAPGWRVKATLRFHSWWCKTAASRVPPMSPTCAWPASWCAIRSSSVPELAWLTLNVDQADPLEVVTDGDADYAIVDANEFEFARHLYPDATVAFTLPESRQLKWIVPIDALDLAQAANGFFVSAKSSGEFARIAREASAESRGFDYEDAHRFQADLASRLPELQPMFEQAARVTGLDWRLVAAVGYQESKWQTRAASADGARGIMMLTPDTASAVGVKDRSDQWQSILGGAKYLAQIIDTIPKRVGEPDRTWLALAAYNVGYGHLEDARVLAQMRGKDPDSWNDVRAQLPLLAQEQWYSRVKRGYARGWEPAKYVEQVRQYLAVLEWTGTGTVARLHH